MTKLRNATRPGILILMMFACVIPVMTQQAQDEVEIVPATEEGCHTNTRNVANFGAMAQTTKDKVFVIAHLGTGESAELNRRRLHDIKEGFAPNFDPKKIILAEGDRVQGPGRVYFYLGSKLESISMLSKNSEFWGDCGYKKKVPSKSKAIRSTSSNGK